MGFGERLAQARQRLKMTQTDLGKGLGTNGADVGKQVVYGWEKEQHFPRVDQLALICDKLNVPADWLLFGDEAQAKARVRILESLIQDLTGKNSAVREAPTEEERRINESLTERAASTKPRSKRVG